MTALAGPLTKEQRLLLAEALRRAELARDTIEDAVVELGRWLLVHVFEDDSTAALEGRRDNPVWRELLDRAGGPSLKMPARALHISVRIAAFDKRIQDEAWRNLEPGRKELLLPLRSEEALREGAQHVTAMKLSHRDTKAYVKAHLPPQGEASQEGHVPVRRSARGVDDQASRHPVPQIGRPGVHERDARGASDHQGRDHGPPRPRRAAPRRHEGKVSPRAGGGRETSSERDLMGGTDRARRTVGPRRRPGSPAREAPLRAAPPIMGAWPGRGRPPRKASTPLKG